MPKCPRKKVFTVSEFLGQIVTNSVYNLWFLGNCQLGQIMTIYSF